ncbi:MAG: hypothetical protein LBR21_05960 [Propionibacteriaceae bacterium]|jgi:hypothetical protein|nr:hypothetical protein [Propionibacteriaceae bacterium]
MAQPAPVTLSFKPTAVELWRTFALPLAGLVLSAALVVFALSSGPLWFQFWVGAILVAGCLALMLLELRDLTSSSVSWDGAGITLAKAGTSPLELPWASVRAVRVRLVEKHEGGLIPGRRRNRLWLEVEPVTEMESDYAEPDVPGMLGVRAGEGRTQEAWLDAQLADLPLYAPMASTRVESFRELLKRKS